MLFIDKNMVEQNLPMNECIPLMRQTLTDYSARRAIQVLRTAMEVGEHKILGIMPAVNASMQIAGAKIITVFHDNFQKGLPSHQGVVVVFESETGSLKAIVDGEGITGIRTAAASAVATDALSRKDSHVLCMLGSGLQARRHLEAIRLVRDIREVRVWDVSLPSAARYASEMSEKYGIPVFDCSDDLKKAVQGADIICTVTAAKTPILLREHVSPGTHINAVGACAATDRELCAQLVKSARLFGDSIESVTMEAGDYLLAIADGVIEKEHLLAELGHVLLGEFPGRTSEQDITIFEALGLAVEDLASADHICRRMAAVSAQQEGGACHDDRTAVPV